MSLDDFKNLYRGDNRSPRVAAFERDFSEIAGHIEGVRAVIEADGHALHVEPDDSDGAALKITVTRARDNAKAVAFWRMHSARLEAVSLVWGCYTYPSVLGDVGCFEPIRVRREFTQAFNSFVNEHLRGGVCNG